jgi:hypothetical protein
VRLDAERIQHRTNRGKERNSYIDDDTQTRDHSARHARVAGLTRQNPGGNIIPETHSR